MAAAEKLQLLVIEALDANAEAVEGEGSQHRCIFLGEIVGVGLYGDLCIRLNSIVLVKGFEDPFKVMSLQAGGGTSSEVDGADRFLRLLPTNGCLHTKCLHESIYVGLVCTHVKVAVGATRLAERYMEIDAGHYSVSCL
jgi:hypothetical protein